MSAHTPGPWKAVCRSVLYEGGDWSEDDFLQWEIEGPRVVRGRGDFYQADARLIAAAPDLLAALIEARDMLATAIKGAWEGSTDADVAENIGIKRIDAAIAKATEAA